MQALADEMAVQRQRAEEAEGQLTQERRSFVEKRQVWQAEREAMEREHEETKRALQVRCLAPRLLPSACPRSASLPHPTGCNVPQRMEAAAEERFAERRSRALGHVVAVGGTATLRRAFAHWRVDVAVAGAGDRAYEAGEASQRLSVSQEELLRRQRQQLRRTLLRLRSNNLWRGLRQWQAYLLIADAEEAEARRREFAVQAQSAQASMERAAAEQARREEAREQRRRRVLETTPAEVTDTYVADLVARYTAARDEGEVGEEDKEAMGVVDRRVSAVVGAQLSVAEQQGRPLVARSCAPLPGRPFVSAFHSHWEADVQARWVGRCAPGCRGPTPKALASVTPARPHGSRRCNDVSEAVEQALEAKGVPADVARQDDDGALLAALVVDQRESLAAPVHQRMRGVESFLHRQLYPEGAEGETGAKGAEEEGSTTASGAKLPRKEVFDLATEVGCELSGRMPPERPPSQLLRRAMEPVRSRAALRVTRFGTLACGDEPSDGEEDEDSADRLRASRDPSYALVRAATSVLLDTEDPRAADARLTTSSDLVRAALVAEARAAAGDRRGGGRGRGVQAQGLEEYDNVLRASREAGRTLLGGQSSEEEGRRKSRLSGRSQHAARRTPWGQRASVTRPRGGAQGWESRAWRQSGSHGRARDDSTSGGVDETGGSDEGEEDDDDEDEESSEEEGDEGEPGAEAGSRSAARRRPGTREGQAGQVPGRKAEHGAEAASPPRERPRARRLDGVGDRSSARGRGAKAGSDPPVPSWSQSPTREPVASRPATSAAQAPPPPSPSSALSASADETPVPFDTRRAQRNRASDAAPAPSATQSRSLPTQEASASASASASSSSSSQAPAPAGAPESASGRRARAAGTASISTGLSTASAIVSTSDSSPPHAPAAKPSPAAALVAADSPSSAGQASSSRDAEWGRRVRPGSSDRGGATFDAPSEEERDEEQQEEDVGDSWATARPMAASVAASRRAEVASDDVQSTAPVSADPESPSTHSWDDESTMSVSARHQPAERQGGPSAGGGRAAPAAGGAAAAEAPAPGDQAATPSRGRVASSWARAFSTQHDSTDEEESVLSSPGQRAAPAPAALGQAGAGVEGGTTEVAHFVPSPDSSPSRGAPSPEHRGRDLTHAALPPPTVAAPSAAGRERATGGVAVRRPGSAALRDFDDDFDEDDSLEVETL